MTAPNTNMAPAAPVTPPAPPPSDAADVAASRAHTTSAAREIAQMVAGGMRDATPPPVLPPVTPPEQTLEAPLEAAAGVDESGAAEELTPVDLNELNALLVESGLDFGITPDQVPEEFRPNYERLVRSAAQMLEDTLSERIQAQDAVASVNLLRDRLEKSPDKVLLAYAVSQPEVFEKITQVFAEMQQDPRVKDLVRRELEADARLNEAQRLQNATLQRDAQSRTRAVINATKAAAAKYGVPYESAEKVVALVIRAEQGNIGPEHVDQIVGDMVPRLKARPRPTVTQAKLDKVNQAPTNSTAPAAPPAPGGTQTPPDSKSMGGFRSLVRDAVSKFTNSQQ